MRTGAVVLATTCMASMACAGSPEPAASETEAPAAESESANGQASPSQARGAITRVTISGSSPILGLSGLARDGDTLFSVAERDAALIAISESGRARRVGIADLPQGYDLESVANLGPGRFAIGTESSAEIWASAAGQREALVLFVEVAGEKAHSAGAAALPFALWGVTPAENQGIEGLCAAGDVLVAGIETVIERDGQRFAPLASRQGDGPWKPALLRLTSAEGKVSSLECRSRDGAIEMLAIERHFGVMRILRWVWDAGRGDVHDPVIALDLTELVAQGSLNFEGLAWMADDGLALVLDNQYKTVTGPSELFLLPPL